MLSQCLIYWTTKRGYCCSCSSTERLKIFSRWLWTTRRQKRRQLWMHREIKFGGNRIWVEKHFQNIWAEWLCAFLSLRWLRDEQNGKFEWSFAAQRLDRTTNLEVMGLNLSGCWAFVFFFFSHLLTKRFRGFKQKISVLYADLSNRGNTKEAAPSYR